MPVERDARGSIDPLMNTTTAVALFNAFRQGTAMSLMAILGATPGNRFCVIAPAGTATGLRPGGGGLMTLRPIGGGFDALEHRIAEQFDARGP